MQRFGFRLSFVLFALALPLAGTSFAGKPQKGCESILLNRGPYFETKRAYEDPWKTGGNILVMTSREKPTYNDPSYSAEKFNKAFEEGALNRFIALNPALMSMYGFSANIVERHYPDIKALNGRLDYLQSTGWATEFRYWNNKSGNEVQPLKHVRLRSQNKLIYSPPTRDLVKAAFHYHELSLHWAELFLPAPVQKASVETDLFLIAIYDSPVLSKNRKLRAMIKKQIEIRSQNLDRLTAELGRELIDVQEGKFNSVRFRLFDIANDGYAQELWKKEIETPSNLRLTKTQIAELRKILARYPGKVFSTEERERITDELLARFKMHQ